VQEKSTGSVNFSLGYSTSEYVVGSIGLTERNFLGKGYNVNLSTTASWYRQNITFSFTNPYFMGMPVSAGFDVFVTNANNQSESNYNSQQLGFALRTGFRLDEYSGITLRYGLMWRDVDGISKSSAAPAVIQSGGKSLKSFVNGTYTWDNLDNPLRPTNGFRGQVVGEVAGLGGDVYYSSIEVHGWYFYPIYEEAVVLKLEGNAGQMWPFAGHDVPLQDRFFKGGDTFRGFLPSGVGPMQRGNDGDTDSIGGKTYAIGTVEMTFPIGLPEEWGIGGAVFSDFGTIFGSETDTELVGTGDCKFGATRDCVVFDTAAFRASVGAGILWQSPFGPLRFELAYPLLKADYDKTEYFRFSIGTVF
jgi:outer membrane protein insertion porin family